MRNGLLISKMKMTTPEGEQVISSGWSVAGITNAQMKNGETCLEPLVPFADIDPLVSKSSVEQDHSNIFQIDKGLIQHLSYEDEKDSCDLEWEFEDGDIFDVIAQELSFVIFIYFLQIISKIHFIELNLHFLHFCLFTL